MDTYFDGTPIPDCFTYSGKGVGVGEMVILDVIKHGGYKWAVLHRYRDGDVLAIKLPFTKSPLTEPDAWIIRRFFENLIRPRWRHLLPKRRVTHK